MALTMFPLIKGPGKTPSARTVLWVSFNITSHNAWTKNERAAESIRSEIGVSDLKLGNRADGGGDAP